MADIVQRREESVMNGSWSILSIYSINDVGCQVAFWCIGQTTKPFQLQKNFLNLAYQNAVVSHFLLDPGSLTKGSQGI